MTHSLATGIFRTQTTFVTPNSITVPLVDAALMLVDQSDYELKATLAEAIDALEVVEDRLGDRSSVWHDESVARAVMTVNALIASSRP